MFYITFGFSTIICLLIVYTLRQYVYLFYIAVRKLMILNNAIQQFPTEDKNNSLFGGPSLLPKKHEEWMHNWQLTVKHPRYLGIRVAYILPVLKLTHPDVIKIVLKSHNSKGFLYETGFRKFAGDGLLTISGSKWRRHRKLLAPAFYGNLLRDQIETIDSCTLILVEKIKSLDRHVDINTGTCTKNIKIKSLDQNIDTNQGAAIKDAIDRYLADAALRVFFSKLDPIQLEHNAYNPCRSIKVMFDTLNDMVQKPWLYSDFIFSRTSTGRKAKKEIKALHAYADDIVHRRVDERRNKIPDSEKSLPDVLDKLFDAVDEDGNGMNNREIRDEV